MMGSIKTIFREWQRRERVSQIDTSYNHENGTFTMDKKVQSDNLYNIDVVYEYDQEKVLIYKYSINPFRYLHPSAPQPLQGQCKP